MAQRRLGARARRGARAVAVARGRATSRAGGRTTRTCSATTSRGAGSASTSGSAALRSACARARRCSTSSWSSSCCGCRQRVQWQRLDRPLARAAVAGRAAGRGPAEPREGEHRPVLPRPAHRAGQRGHPRAAARPARARARVRRRRAGSTATCPARPRAPTPTGSCGRPSSGGSRRRSAGCAGSRTRLSRSELLARRGPARARPRTRV